MKFVLAPLTAALLPLVSAWPLAMEMDNLLKRAGTGRPNTGAADYFPTFDGPAQYVDVTPGSGHEFQAPGPNDLRGECPGLNAASNHGFLPRSGLATIAQTITGLGDAYNMSPDLAGVLAALAVFLTGDIPTQTWSIGGGFPASNPALTPVAPQGILGSHDQYENDASVARGDAYLNGGKVGVFQYRSWNNLYSLIGEDGLTLDKGANHTNYVTDYSIQNNPYAFWGPFSGLVAPAAMNFVINFMSNHTAQNPGGYLDANILKTFFAVTGDTPDTFVQHRGQEAIPLNWYRRPGGTQQYNAVNVFQDLIAGATLYPGTLRLGGNTGKVNTFTGVDVGDFTEGVFNGATLLQGNNLACFAFRAAQAGGIQELRGLYNTLGSLLDPILAPLNSIFSELDCPVLANVDYSTLEIFPGYSYQDRAIQNE